MNSLQRFRPENRCAPISRPAFGPSRQFSARFRAPREPSVANGERRTISSSDQRPSYGLTTLARISDTLENPESSALLEVRTEQTRSIADYRRSNSCEGTHSMDWMSVFQQLSTSLRLRKIYDLVNRVPVLRPALKRFLRTAIPADALVWTSIRSGPGKGLRVHINPRYEMGYLGAIMRPRSSGFSCQICGQGLSSTMSVRTSECLA